MMRLTLLFALALIAALLASPASSFIAFHNITTKAPITGAVHLPLSYTGTSIGISLRERPLYPVVVAWDGRSHGTWTTLFPGDKPCSAFFTANNWNVTQAVTLANPMQASPARDALTAPVKFRAFSPNCRNTDHGKLVQLNANRHAFPNTQCSIKTVHDGASEGMHVRAFGEVPYHFMSEGSYYILRSDSVAIVAELRRCKGASNAGGACMTRMAIVLDGSTIHFNPANIVQSKLGSRRANGRLEYSRDPRPKIPMSMSVPLGVVPGGVSMEYKVQLSSWAEVISLKLRTGLSIQLTSASGDRPAITEVIIRPDLELSQRGATNGLCGAFDVNLPENKPVDKFRAGSALFEAKQLIHDSSTVPRTSSQYASTSLAKFVESTRVPANLNPFSLTYSQPKMMPMGRGYMTGNCNDFSVEETYRCGMWGSRPGLGFDQYGVKSQWSVAEGESLFQARSAHYLDGANCDSSEDGAGDALFSVSEGDGRSDRFEDAVDQFWDELGSDE